MREDLLREVYQDLQEQQRQNEETENARKQEIRAGYPEIGALMEKREAMIQEGIQAILRGEGTAADLPAWMDAMSAEIRGALRANGFPENYLAPVYSCPFCQDTGFTGDQVREKCSCVQKRYQKKLRRAVGLPEDGSETFARFDLDLFSGETLAGSQFSQRDMMKKIRNVCEKWAEDWPNQQPRDMVLAGKSGLGKTFLLHAMASRLIERGCNVLLLSAYSFLEIARKSYFENDDRLQELIDTDVLMLDDLGSEPMMQNITIEQLFNLINERQRRNRATVISTNFNQDDLKNRYTERIASRLTDRKSCQFLYLRGQDIRNGRS